MQKYIVQIASIVGISGVTGYAISQGTSEALVLTAIAAVAGIAGYALNKANQAVK